MREYHERGGRTRRSVLGASVAGAAALAGCLDGLPLVGGPGRREVASEEPPSENERRNTPGEFRWFVEENGIETETLIEDGSELVLLYYTEEENLDDFLDEIGVIVTVYNERLVVPETGYTMLYCEIQNPFDDGPVGWGARTEWLEEYNATELGELELFINIQGTFVYEEDLE